MLRFVLVLFFVSACSTQPVPITGAEYARLLSPGTLVTAEVDQRLPRMLQENQILEEKILKQGRRLTIVEQGWAHALGVNQLGRVRILVVDKIPSHNRFEILNTQLSGATFLGLGGRTGGLTTGYGILVVQDFVGNDWLIAHELVHVAQFEALGRDRMLRRVLTERTILGDKLIPIEREAIAKSAMLLGRDVPAYAVTSPNHWITLPLR